MRLMGIPLRKPTFDEITAAVVMGAGLWLAVLGALRALNLPLDRADAGALLLVVMWGCIGVRVGIRVGAGKRHLAANMLVSAALLCVAELARRVTQ